MNSIFKLITNQQIPETANALVPVIGYEPWSLRALESIKSSIVNGVPTLIRVHSAADYPIENEELSHRLDMESHCVLIVGYINLIYKTIASVGFMQFRFCLKILV